MVIDDDSETLAKDEVAILKALGMAPIGEASTLQTTFSKPMARESTLTPEEEVAAACGQNSALAEANANVEFYKAELAAIEGVEAKALMLPVIQKALKDAEEKAASFSKSTKTLSLVSLQLKRTKAMEDEEKRVSSSTTLREKAQARYDRLHAVLLKQQEIVQKRLEAFTTAFAESSKEWLNRESELISAHVECLAAWDVHIATADAASGGHLANMAAHPAALPQAAAPAAASVPPLAQLLVPLAAPPPTNQHHPDCFLATSWRAEDLPALSRELTDHEEQLLSCIMANVRAWQCHGMIPATYKMMSSGLKCDESAIVEAFRQIVGKTIWEAFYGERQITSSDYVPAQLGYVTREALDRVREALEKSKYAKETRETAGKVFTKHLAEDTKRRKAARTSLPDAGNDV
jgi:hypothetical protein